MDPIAAQIVQRLDKLGLKATEIDSDHVNSAMAALACFPMYMVANVHAWTQDRQFHIPLVDLPGAEAIREAFAIGGQENQLELDREHRRLLGTMLSHAKPADRIIYEYALETLRLLLQYVQPTVARELRMTIAHMIMKVAKASGEGWFGTGPKISPQEKECIQQIDRTLGLSEAPEAVEILRELAE